MRAFRETDFVQINQWRALRGVPILPFDLYPPNGLIVPGVAVGFINFTQTKMALFENFLTNPESDSKEREDAIFEIVEGLEKLAYDGGDKWIVAVTNHPKIEKYIYHCKWERFPYKIFGKEL